MFFFGNIGLLSVIPAKAGIQEISKVILDRLNPCFRRDDNFISCMSISIEEIKKIADLARIKLSEEEERRHAKTISVVLDYMKILDEVDINGVEITCQVTGLENVTRKDEVIDCENSDKLIKQMPEVEFDKLKVPGVFNNNDN